jgi:hypothetical protein
MAIDALEAVIKYIATDADMNTLTGGQIAAKHQFGNGWTIPSKAVQVRYDGGRPDLYTRRQLARLEVRCYGEEQYEAGRVYRRLVELTRGADRRIVETAGEGYALIYWLLMSSGASFFSDPDTGVDCVLCFCDAAVAEQDVERNEA